MKTLCLTGWQQPYDALKDYAPEDALHLDYSACAHEDELYEKIAGHGADFDTLVGWSLGGQLLLKALDDGVLNAKRLVLLSTAWQIVQTQDFLDATPPEVIAETISNYKKDAVAVMESFQALLLMGDAQQKHLAREYLCDTPAIWPCGLQWLKFLQKFSCARLRWNNLPKSVTFIHGDADVIAPVGQMEYFRRSIRQAEIYIIEGCAHAPHWHDADVVREVIKGQG